MRAWDFIHLVVRPRQAAEVDRCSRPRNRQGATDEVTQLLRPKGLRQDRVHAQLLQVSPLFANPRADHHDTQTLTAIRVRPEPPDHVVASHPWHGQVQQHEVEAMLSEDLDRLDTVSSGRRRVAKALDHTHQDVADVFVVIDNEEAQ